MQQESSLSPIFPLSAARQDPTPSPMAACEKDLLDVFKKLGIEFKLFRHPPFFTVEDCREYRQHMPGGHCKCLFLKDKKGNMVLAAAHEDVRLDLKALAKTLGLGRFSFCHPERLEKVLGVTPGAVTPYALMNVPEGSDKAALTVVVDEKLLIFDIVNFHPLHNEATVAVKPDDLLKFIRHYGFSPKIMKTA
ncbi:MAG: prolyl-tRNA synthetase associated domain-containing protein [Proteobacteria bacterium]|nr:prolyl-tRNA synthetase associated domain-containing protein [Pseudomonadota bacterium]